MVSVWDAPVAVARPGPNCAALLKRSPDWAPVPGRHAATPNGGPPVRHPSRPRRMLPRSSRQLEASRPGRARIEQEGDRRAALRVAAHHQRQPLPGGCSRGWASPRGPCSRRTGQVEIFPAARHRGDPGVGVEHIERLSAHLLQSFTRQPGQGGPVVPLHAVQRLLAVDGLQSQVRVIAHNSSPLGDMQQPLPRCRQQRMYPSARRARRRSRAMPIWAAVPHRRGGLVQKPWTTQPVDDSDETPAAPL